MGEIVWVNVLALTDCILGVSGNFWEILGDSRIFCKTSEILGYFTIFRRRGKPEEIFQELIATNNT